VNKQDKPIEKFQSKLLDFFDKIEKNSLQKPMNLALRGLALHFQNARQV